MHETPIHRRLMILLLATLALGACGGSTSDDEIEEDSGVVDPIPFELNVLNGTFTGGHAAPVEITAVMQGGEEDRAYVYDDELEADCENAWAPSGPLCDEAPDTHSRTRSATYHEDIGATWYAADDDDSAALVTGVLVVDACSDGACAWIRFDEARVFQMFSDGKLTHLRLSIHPETGGTPPSFADADWTPITGFEPIGAGQEIGEIDVDESFRHVVASPTALALDEVFETRYVKIEARNDGSLGDEYYTELRSLKLFGEHVLD
jgi:hypothetical protein